MVAGAALPLSLLLREYLTKMIKKIPDRTSAPAAVAPIAVPTAFLVDDGLDGSGDSNGGGGGEGDSNGGGGGEGGSKGG